MVVTDREEMSPPPHSEVMHSSSSEALRVDFGGNKGPLLRREPWFCSSQRRYYLTASADDGAGHAVKVTALAGDCYRAQTVTRAASRASSNCDIYI